MASWFRIPTTAKFAFTALCGTILLSLPGSVADAAEQGATLALSEDDAAPAAPCATQPFGKGCWSLGFSSGYALPFHFDAANSDVEDSAFVPLFPRLAVSLTEPLGGESWLRGNFELAVEGHFLAQTAPHGGSAWGVSLLGRYNFLTGKRIVPFVELGGGLIDLDFGLRKRADGFNFALQGGLGIHWLSSDRTALSALWRYHHISNSRINEPNVAVDSSMFLIGVTLFMN